MATLVFTFLGNAVGGAVGAIAGAMVGQSIDRAIFGPGGTREGPRLDDLKVTTSSYGAVLPRIYGKMRVPGQIVWSTDLKEHRDKQVNGKGKPSTVTYSYSVSFAVALASRPIGAVGRVWADGKLLRGSAGDLKVGGTMRLHSGFGDQPADPLIAAIEGAPGSPAHRGTAYVVFEDLDLSEYGNRIPTLSFEVFADEAALTLADLCEGAVERFSAPTVLTELAGFTIEGSLAEALSLLDPVFPIDCDGCDELLTIGAAGGLGVPLLLDEAATTSEEGEFGGNAGYTRRRRLGESDAPGVLRYYDLDRDYLPGSQRTVGRPTAGEPATLELPAALASSDARSLIEQARQRAKWGRQSVSWRVTQLDPAVRPGTLVRLPDAPGVWRVAAWEWRPHGVDLTLERIALEPTALAAPTDPGRVNPPSDLPLPATQLAAFELPWDGNPATPVPLLVAAASSANAAWSGASLFADTGDGNLVALGATGRIRASIGAATTILAPASPLLVDRRNSVTIQLAGTDLGLADATARQLAMGANRALLGEEIIQFGSAIPLGAGLWRLENLWRGQGGTENFVATHAIGERFVLLDNTGIALDPALVGAALDAQIVAVGLADPVPVTSAIALRGIAVRPPAPVHGVQEVAAAGTIAYSWARRARGGWLWLDQVDTPLAETTEAYVVTFGDPAAPLASWETGQPRFEIAASELAALRASAPTAQLAVRQRGDRAISLPLTLPLP